jgi:hypothetical protein
VTSDARRSGSRGHGSPWQGELRDRPREDALDGRARGRPVLAREPPDAALGEPPAAGADHPQDHAHAQVRRPADVKQEVADDERAARAVEHHVLVDAGRAVDPLDVEGARPRGLGLAERAIHAQRRRLGADAGRRVDARAGPARRGRAGEHVVQRRRRDHVRDLAERVDRRRGGGGERDGRVDRERAVRQAEDRRRRRHARAAGHEQRRAGDMPDVVTDRAGCVAHVDSQAALTDIVKRD